MFANKLDRLIEFEIKTISQNSIGEPIKNWTASGSTWATVSPSSAGYKFTQGTIETNVGSTQFFCRYRNLTYDYRIKYDNQYYYPTDISEVGRKEALKIIATNKLSE